MHAMKSNNVASIALLAMACYASTANAGMARALGDAAWVTAVSLGTAGMYPILVKGSGVARRCDDLNEKHWDKTDPKTSREKRCNRTPGCQYKKNRCTTGGYFFGLGQYAKDLRKLCHPLTKYECRNMPRVCMWSRVTRSCGVNWFSAIRNTRGRKGVKDWLKPSQYRQKTYMSATRYRSDDEDGYTTEESDDDDDVEENYYPPATTTARPRNAARAQSRRTDYFVSPVAAENEQEGPLRDYLTDREKRFLDSEISPSLRANLLNLNPNTAKLRIQEMIAEQRSSTSRRSSSTTTSTTRSTRTVEPRAAGNYFADDADVAPAAAQRGRQSGRQRRQNLGDDLLTPPRGS